MTLEICQLKTFLWCSTGPGVFQVCASVFTAPSHYHHRGGNRHSNARHYNPTSHDEELLQFAIRQSLIESSAFNTQVQMIPGRVLVLLWMLLVSNKHLFSNCIAGLFERFGWTGHTIYGEPIKWWVIFMLLLFVGLFSLSLNSKDLEVYSHKCLA